MAAGCYILHQSLKCTSVHEYLLESYVICMMFLVHVVVLRDIKPLTWQLLFPRSKEKMSTAIGSCWRNLNLNFYHGIGAGINTGLTFLLHQSALPREQNQGLTPARCAPTPAFLPSFALS